MMKKNDESINELSLNKNLNKKKLLLNIKYLNDTSYELFNAIFNNIELKNIKKEKVVIKDYNDFKNFQIFLNSYYINKIKRFEYNDKNNFSIIKEIPYKPTRLRKIYEEDENIAISPNGIFARTNIIENKSESSLAYYINIIGNAIIINGNFYYEIKILELGGNTDLFFGIISIDSQIFKNKEFRKYSINEFNDGYAINLNNYYELENSNQKYLIKEGDNILVEINIKDNSYINFYINGKKIKNDRPKLEIEKNVGYYPAFSLSSEKGIQVNFGGIYNISYELDRGNLLNKKPISSYNNSSNIVSCYLEIIENNLIKIINHPQIPFNESINYFYPMLNFLANTFNDEFIVKNNILKFMYEKYDNLIDIYEYFNKKYNLIYLIIQTIELKKQKNAILFLLDCLTEEIKYYSYYDVYNYSLKIWYILIKLYNFFIRRKLFQNILFENNEKDKNFIFKKIKNQLYIIFNPIKIYGIYLDCSNFDEYSKEDEDEMFKKIDNFIISKFNGNINPKLFLEPFEELIKTLINPILEFPDCNLNKIDKLINNNIDNNQKNEEIEGEFNNKKYPNNNFDILIYYLNEIISLNQNKIFSYLKYKIELINKNINEKNNRINDKINLLSKKRKIKNSYYREIFVDLIKDIYFSKSKRDLNTIISTIFFPLLKLYNENVQKEKSLSLINNQFLSFLPLIDGDNTKLIEKSAELIISKDIFYKNENLKNIINPEILNFELYNKKYNISSYLLKIILNIFYFFDNNIDYYKDKCFYKNLAFWEYNKNRESLYLNNYYSKLKNMLLILNKDFYEIIENAANSLISYFSELLDNNFYLLIPFEIFNNGIKYLIKYFFNYSFLHKNLNFLNAQNINDLILLYINFSLKLLNNKYINEKIYLLKVIENMRTIFNLFDTLKDLENDEHEDNESINKKKY